MSFILILIKILHYIKKDNCKSWWTSRIYSRYLFTVRLDLIESKPAHPEKLKNKLLYPAVISIKTHGWQMLHKQPTAQNIKIYNSGFFPDFMLSFKDPKSFNCGLNFLWFKTSLSSLVKSTTPKRSLKWWFHFMLLSDCWTDDQFVKAIIKLPEEEWQGWHSFPA